MAVEKGDTIKVDYEGTLDDGTVFDSSKDHEEPLTFEVGGGQLIPAFDEAVVGMEVGDEKEFHVDVESGYGEHRDELVQSIPREQFPSDEKVEVGMMIAVGLPTGEQLPAWIIAMDDENITLDLNHPLAGKELNFKVRLVEILSNIIT